MSSSSEPGFSVAPGWPSWPGVQGELYLAERPGGGNTGGRWFVDEAEVMWFLKLDMHHLGLQTSAEVISARVLACLGYRVPPTHKIIRGSLHLSVARDVGEAVDTTRFEDMDSSAVRQLRVICAYLKDWDRVAPRTSNNLVHADGRITLIDFGGTLGARALGQHKSGPVSSEAIGCYEATGELSVLWDGFRVAAESEHPWNRITPADVGAAVARLATLDDGLIERIVEAAQYPTARDAALMAEALRVRRDGLVEGLPRRFAAGGRIAS
ncbi:MAG: hypothetical protein H6712_21780 [Myxococcales bacterium]|nr:hypothetical protein [Myxococcales bacterium]